jgi:hypothetical protein
LNSFVVKRNASSVVPPPLSQFMLQRALPLTDTFYLSSSQSSSCPPMVLITSTVLRLRSGSGPSLSEVEAQTRRLKLPFDRALAGLVWASNKKVRKFKLDWILEVRRLFMGEFDYHLPFDLGLC